MSRVQSIHPRSAEESVRKLYDPIRSKLGRVPNMMRVMANSPAVLKGYLGLSDSLSSTLDAAERELIALAVAGVNGCDYCDAAHSTLARRAGLTPEEIFDARNATGHGARRGALVHLAATIAATRGQIEDFEIEEARDAGLTDADIAEVVANVALNFFTNLINNVAEPEIDFPAPTSPAESMTVPAHEGARCEL